MPHKHPPEPKTLRNWYAQRAGGRITVYGDDIQTRLSTKITNVDTIKPPVSAAEHFVLATDKHGTVHKLVFS